ncbi:MAG: HAMP domain-containing histidine kinase [Lachnospiraceae bacterium]|jgi:signal transduction histidine kinase|nr:HAMP domain-containing histidine kinase [Lachnospiraceae bacterium]MCI1301820.1 HAMP domain-containing histidine kinase [Lachnospiraceae bacterium]
MQVFQKYNNGRKTDSEKVSLVHSIRFRITALIGAIVLGMTCTLLLLNTFMVEPYYLSTKRKDMVTAYGEVNSVMNDYMSGAISKDDTTKQLDQMVSPYSVNLVIVDSSWEVIYSNTRDAGMMLQKIQETVLGGIPLRDGEGDNNNVTIIEKNDSYTLQKSYDARLNDNFYELWGTYGNGTTLLMRMPLLSVRDTIVMTNRFIQIAGILIFVIGLVTASGLSGFISRPIKHLSEIASRMSSLDFDVRYEGHDRSEIGVLGRKMNDMSESLEETISELKSANTQLQRDIERKTEIDNMRKEFLSNVSHDLKTPIALIQGYAEGLRDGIADDPESSAYYCGVILDESKKMNIMVRRLLDLNQIEFGNEKPVMKRFDLAQLLHDCVSANRLTAQKDGIELVYEGPESGIDAWSDETKVDEMITNYLSNAIHYAAGRKQIRVWETDEGTNRRVHVFNTGNPIPDEETNRIWEKFYKIDKARTLEYSGNGIGLSIVKAICDSYGKQCGVLNHQDGVEFWFDVDGSALDGHDIKETAEQKS